MTDTGPGDPPEPTEAPRCVRGHDAPGAGRGPPQAAPRLRRRARADEVEGDGHGDAQRMRSVTPTSPRPRRRSSHPPSPRRAPSGHPGRSRPRRRTRGSPDSSPTRSAAGRQLQRVLRRPDLGGPGDGRRRADRRAHRRLAGRADDDDPGQGAHEGPRPRVRHDVPHPDGAGARNLPGRGHRGGEQRGRSEPGRVRRGAARAGRPPGTLADHRLRRRRRPHASPRRADRRPASTCATSTPASRWPTWASNR